VTLPEELRRRRDEPLCRAAAGTALLRPGRRRQFQASGARSIGTRHAAIASDTLLVHGLWLSVERTAWDAAEPALLIGDRSPSARSESAPGQSVVIEDVVTIGAGSGTYDSNHTVAAAHKRILGTPLSSRSDGIGEGSWLGDRVTVLSGADIGRGCIIGAGSLVRGIIPDHAIAVGVPTRVICSTQEGPA
jgi:acetyltransferase-like isoleucine patch superfamily enzyme